MIKFILLCLVLSATNANCGPGCLQCDIYANCRLCDFQNYYVLQNGSCALKTIPNCASMSVTGLCIQCQGPYFYLDPSTSNCVALALSDMVLFCSAHSGPGVCIQCEGYYFLSNDTCTFVSNIVSYCLQQNSTATCGVCAPYFYPSSMGQYCLPVQTTQNCALYSQYQCTQCSSGYVLNNNLYGAQFNPLALTSPNSYFNLLQGLFSAAPFVVQPNVCQQIPTANCAVTTPLGVCASCQVGYFLNSALTCQVIVAQLNFCNRFLLPNNCVECAQGYNLVNPALCAPVTTVPNCNTYSQTSPVTVCTSCQANMFPLNSTFCAPRKNSISSCQTYDSNFDRCQACQSGWVTSVDGLYCLTAVANCTTYATLNATNSSAPTCVNCNSGFYLNTTLNLCSAGSVANCTQYFPNTQQCLTCANGFYNSGFLCVQSAAIPDCATFSQTSPTICNKCNNKTILTTVTTSCLSTLGIANCLIYLSPSMCSQCNLGYYVVGYTQCLAIPANLNCLNYTGIVCVQCSVDYVLTTFGTCRLSIYIYKTYCNTTNITGGISSQVEGCSTCAASAIPLDFFEMYYCVEKFYLPSAVSSAFDVNCQNWRLNPATNVYACTQCIPGYFLATSRSCALGCTASGLTTVYPYVVPMMPTTNLVKFDTALTVNTCGTTVTNCAYATVQVPQTSTTTSYVCTQCVSGNAAVVSLTDPIVGMFPFIVSTYMPFIRRNVFLPELSCLAQSTVAAPTSLLLLYIFTNTTQLTPNCEYYSNLANYAANTGCLKCLWGYTGRVVDYIANCYSFTGTTCTTCRLYNYPISPVICYPVWPIPFCLKFDQSHSTTTCLVCTNAYYLKPFPNNALSNYCEASTVQSNCVTYSQTVDGCSVCATNYFLIFPSCYLLPTHCITMVLASNVGVCSVCDNTVSYLSSTPCSVGTINFCATYAAVANTCLVCTNGYYLATSTSCVVHPAIPSCSVFDQTTSGQCDTCNLDAFLFSVINTCTAITLVSHCSTYSTIALCSACNAGYQLSADMLHCATFTAPSNCAQSDPLDLSLDGTITASDYITGNTFLYSCTKCNVNYMRFSTTTAYTLATGASSSVSVYTCLSYFNFVTQNCLASNNDGTAVYDTVRCSSGCSTGNLPLLWTGLNMCIENTYITSVSAFVTNCMQYMWSPTTSKYVCNLCNTGFYLQSDNSCLSTCTTFIYLWQVTYDATPNPSYFTIPGQNVCAALTQNPMDSDCKVVVPEFLMANARYACLSCKTSANFPLIQFADTVSILSAYDFKVAIPSLNSRLSTPFYPYPSIYQCFTGQATATALGTLNASGLIDNCLYYAPFPNGGTGTFGCVRCSFGFSGPIILDAVSTLGFIQSCTADTNCDTTTVYTGLQGSLAVGNYFGSLHSLFSCHKCTSASKVPVAFVSISPYTFKIANLLPYTIPNTSGIDLTAGSTGLEQNAIVCLDPSTPANLGMTLLTYPSNCALLIANTNGGFDASTPSGTDFTKMNVLCAACSPGYYPTYSTQNGFAFVITTCTAITNCPTNMGLWLNSCSTCTVFGVQATTNLVDYTICTLNTITNCFIGTDTVCNACLPGYSLSQVNTCVAISAPYCGANNVFSNDYLTLLSATTPGYVIDATQTPFYVNSFLIGCTTCAAATGTSLVLLNTLFDTLIPTQACASMGSYYTASVHSTSPFATANCGNYGFDSTGTINCLTCATGYIVTDIYTCVSLTTYPFCATFSTVTGKCTSCVSTSYVMVNYVCTSNSPTAIITNCAAYTTATATSASATCQTCATYYVQADTTLASCVAFVQASFPNCYQVNIALSACTVCAPFYVLTTVASGTYCYPIGKLSSGAHPDHDANCLTYQADTSTTNSFQFYKLTCTSCKSNYMITTTNTYINYCYQFFVSAFTPTHCNSFYVAQPVLSTFTFHCLGCDSVATIYYNPTDYTCPTRTLVTNCTVYTANADTCQTCLTGNSGAGTLTCAWIFVPKNVLPTNIGYIETCVAMSSCQTNTYYGGLTSPLSMVFSCHSCTTAGKIPFVFMSGNAPYSGFQGLKEYGLSGINPPTNFGANVNGTVIQCMNPVAASFNLNAALFAFPTNCALGFVNVDSAFDASSGASATNVDLTKLAVFCVACLPKFKPATATSLASNAVPLMVSSCTAIAFCSTSQTFNSCDLCVAGYSLKYNVGVGISANQCIHYAINPNCLAAVSTSGPCQICKQGYFINRDGICEQLYAVQCTTAYDGLGTNSIEIQTMLALQPFSGCNICNSGFYSLYSLTHMTLCTYSPYLAGQAVASSNYVPNCAIYTNAIAFPQNNLVCATCSTNYILTTVSFCTALNTALANCFMALSSSQCSICNSGFANVDYACVAPVVQFCQTFYPFSTGFQQCLYCQPTYFLENNQCFAGRIANCQVYLGFNRCGLCLPGTILTTLPNYTTQCFVIPTSLNCQYAKSSAFGLSQLQCIACSSNFVLQTLATGASYSLCFNFPQDINCINSDIQTLVSTSSFQCLQCADSYYLSLNQNQCFPRFSSYTNCQTLNLYQDSCNLCSRGFLLSADRTSCIADIEKSPNCIEYDSSQNCLLCASTYFLSNNTCVGVALINLVPNCLYYDENQVCYQCHPAYFFTNGTCAFTYATNCLTYLDPSNCLTCSSGFGITTSNGVSNCVYKNVLNCVQSTNFYPFICQTCDTGFFPSSSGSCLLVTQPVQGCRYYSQDGQCVTCYDTYILSGNGASCVLSGLLGISVDPNCQAISYQDAGVCTVCAAGYYFSNGQCVACFQGVFGSCLICDPTNVNSCLVCNFGYYQNQAGVCTQAPANVNFPGLQAPVEIDAIALGGIAGKAARVWMMFVLILASVFVAPF